MQTINFYLDSYKPVPLSFDSRFALLSVVLCLFGIMILGWIESSQVDSLQQRLAERKSQLNSQQQQLALVTKKLRDRSQIKGLQSQLNKNQAELASYRKILNLVNTPLYLVSVNFSQILKDLSEQTIDSVWLTKIDIQTQSLSLSGATTKPKSIPDYVDKLKNSDSLKRHFDELKIERNEEKQLVEFQLINGRLTSE